jgi:hypothetical protein
MRFSLRLLFGLTAYCALVAAALVTDKGWLVDVVWIVTVLALCYAIAASFIWTARRRAAAVGFVVFASAYLIGWQFFPDRVPVMIGIRAVGYVVSEHGDVYEFNTGRRGASLYAHHMNSPIRVANAIAVLITGFAGSILARRAYESARDSDHNEKA